MLQQAQKRIAELEDENRLLVADNQHLKLVVKNRPGRGKGGKQAPVLVEVPNTAGASSEPITVDDISRWASYFSLFYYPIITAKHFEEGKNISGCTWKAHERTRWVDQKNHILGISMELYGLLPAKYHPLMLLTGNTEHQNSGSFAKRVSG